MEAGREQQHQLAFPSHLEVLGLAPSGLETHHLEEGVLQRQSFLLPVVYLKVQHAQVFASAQVAHYQLTLQSVSHQSALEVYSQDLVGIEDTAIAQGSGFELEQFVGHVGEILGEFHVLGVSSDLGDFLSAGFEVRDTLVLTLVDRGQFILGGTERGLSHLTLDDVELHHLLVLFLLDGV